MYIKKISNIKKVCLAIIPILLILCCFVDTVDAASCPAGGKHYYDVQIVKDATETKDGLERHICTKCGDTYNLVVPKTGHNFTAWRTKSESTCLKDGVKERNCSICGVRQQKLIKATRNHKFGEWKVTAKGDCTHDGAEESICSVCGQNEVRVTKYSGHKYELVKTEESGDYRYDTYICSVCGHKDIRTTAINTPEDTDVLLEPKTANIKNQTTAGGDSGGSGGLNPLEIILLGLNVAAGGFYVFLIRDDVHVLRWYRSRKAFLKGRL